MAKKNYLQFEFKGMSDSGLTKIYDVLNKSTDEKIAEIRWRPGFRRYVTRWLPFIESDSDCEIELAEFKKSLMEERRKAVTNNG